MYSLAKTVFMRCGQLRALQVQRLGIDSNDIAQFAHAATKS